MRKVWRLLDYTFYIGLSKHLNAIQETIFLSIHYSEPTIIVDF